MNELQRRMIEERLTPLLDICHQIGPWFDLNWLDSKGNHWNVKISLQQEKSDDR